MSFPRYPKYKTSGVEWLGDVPEHWEVKRLGTQGKLYGGLTGKVGADFTDVGSNTCRFVPFTNILNNVVVDHCQLSPVQLQAGEMQNEVLEGDLLFLMSSEDFDYLGFSAVVKQLPSPTYLNSFCKGFRPNGRCGSSEFLNYFCRSTAGRALISQQGFGFTRINLRTSALASTPIPSPPLEEQTAIAAFLDHETAKIDELVAEQERLIELLKEKRQAVISHAVTKGLNPDAPMKDSGIEWLGEVPEHWKVVAIKWLSPVRRGASPRPIDDPKYFDEEGEFAWVRIADVSACDGVLNETTQQLSQLGSSLSVKILPGELFVSIAGTVGKPCMSAIKACIHDGFVYFPALKIEPRFLYRIFEGGDCYGGLGKWGTQLNLNTDTVGSIRVALPPEVELNEVLEFLDHETAKFTTLTTEANRVIDLLKERRTALISAAVTGQIDVRNLVSVESA